jgi:fructose 1,6-bisphosphatase
LVASMAGRTTISLTECDIDSLAGHHVVAEPLFSIAEKHGEAKM